MATAKKTSFSDAFVTLEGLETAVAQVRKDGAASGASGFLSEEVPDPAEPAADERPQPVQAAE